MPFPFTLPTTSYISFTDYFASHTHPSFPLAATQARGVLRDVLKQHKRLSPSSQTSNLSTVLSALNDYLPYLFALDAGLSGHAIAGEEIDIILQKELEVEWRPTLSASIPGREVPRVKLRSLESEIFFTVTTLGYTYSLLARAQLLTLYNATTPSPEQRTAAIGSAMKYYLDAQSAHAYLVNRAGQWTTPPPTPDISQNVQSGLASLALAEATLITVTKDDPYPAAVTQDRNRNDKDWMFKSPEMPKVRAHLFARLCLAAAEHASKAKAMLGRARGVDGEVVEYVESLRRTARGKACRFFAVDAEATGKTGEGIAWLRGAKREMGILSDSNGKEEKLSGFKKLKKDFQEKREDKRIEKAGEWGMDAGKFEEGRVVESLERKWVKMNDTVNIQIIPDFQPLLSSMPSGREYHTPKPFTMPTLEEDAIMQMRAPVDPGDLTDRLAETHIGDRDSDDSGDERLSRAETVVGAFPGTGREYTGTPGGSSYY